MKEDNQNTLEFVVLMALLISLTALSIDTILPAFPHVLENFALANANDTQFLISSLFGGFMIGQLTYGAWSDSIGRKPAIYIGLTIFILGSALSIFSSEFSLMIIGRVMQGFGVAAPRIVAIAIIRDQYEGREMARIVSFVTTVFIFVPVVAPSLGQLILMFWNWQAIFVFYILLTLIALIWFYARQPETLSEDYRQAFSFERIWMAIKEIFSNPLAIGYTVATGTIFATFIAYLMMSQQLFGVIYDRSEHFPLYFGSLALTIGAAAQINARLVVRIGMTRMTSISIIALFILSSMMCIYQYVLIEPVPFVWFYTYCCLAFFALGIPFSNLNAMAMEPLGHIAGIGSSIVGAISTLTAVSFGTYIGQQLDKTAMPLFLGFSFMALLSLIILRWSWKRSHR